MNLLPLKSSKISISTSTCNGELKDTEFDLRYIFNNLSIIGHKDLDEDSDNEDLRNVNKNCILGIKYLNKYRGEIKPTPSFFNQISCVIYLSEFDKKTNLKIFGNGKFQITGIKNITQARDSIYFFLKEIVDLNGKTVKKVIIEDNLIYDKKEFQIFNPFLNDRYNFTTIYHWDHIKNTYAVLGERKFNTYNIKKNIVNFDPDNKWFIDIKHKNFIKKLYDLNGNNIGHYEFIMKFKRRNLILHKCSYIEKEERECEDCEDCEHSEPFTYIINNKYNEEIGNLKIVLDKKDIETPEIIDNKITLDCYSITNRNIVKDLFNDNKGENGENGIEDTFINKINLTMSNINSNFRIDLQDRKINRIVLHNLLRQQYKIVSHFDQDRKYPAVNVKLFFDKKLKLLQYNDNYVYKCTALIFDNGKILLSGCTTKEQILKIKKILIDIFTENIYGILIEENTEIINNLPTEDLNIWDIM